MKTLCLPFLFGCSLLLSGCGTVWTRIERDLDLLPRGEFKGVSLSHSSNLGTFDLKIESAVSTDEFVTAEGTETTVTSLWTGKTVFTTDYWHRKRKAASDRPRSAAE